MGVALVRDNWIRRAAAPMFAALSLIALANSSALAADPAPSFPPENLEFFEKQIRPLMVGKCYGCHSVAAGKSKGGLLLDSREALLKGGNGGPSIIPGKPAQSLLIKAVRHEHGDDDLDMPPGDKLEPAEIAALEKWVKDGAADPRLPVKSAAPVVSTLPPVDMEKGKAFWSFQAPKEPAVPAVADAAWSAHPIDRFVFAAMKGKGLTPVPLADKRTLIRRASFDLTGLPPTAEDVAAFAADSSPKAFEKVVDRLLASPQYGERWGRHWLDVARYADTAGDSADYPIPQAYKYRNWVIRAFNDDKPYDQFIREQIAGDLLPTKTDAERYDGIVATGFLALSRRFGVGPESVQHLTIEDTIDCVGKSVLGLTVSCARCHDHKFDPIPTTDYYALYGILSSTRYPFAGSENNKRPRKLVPLATKTEIETVYAPHQKKIDDIAIEVENLEKANRNLNRDMKDATPEARKKQREANDKKIKDLRKQETDLLKTAPPIEMAFAVVEGAPKNAKVMKRGEPSQQGDDVSRRFLTVLGAKELPQDIAGKTSGRVQLGEWLTDAKNPLTARVMVNRIWQHHFGKGIVQTPSDFGKQGKAPTHPELLDWLALRFVEKGWSVKAMHRTIMLSRAYQLAAVEEPKNSTIDPANDFVWRHNRIRLQAEPLRDAMLAVSGDLDPTPGAAHPFPEVYKWGFTQHAQFFGVYETNKRSVYVMQQRLRKHPFFSIFDGADTNSTTAERFVSITPLQALFMMNDSFVHAQADKFAEWMIASSTKPAERVEKAILRAFGRTADAEEVRDFETHVRVFQAKLLSADGSDAKSAEKAEKAAWASVARVLFGSNEFLFVD